MLDFVPNYVRNAHNGISFVACCSNRHHKSFAYYMKSFSKQM